MACEELKSDLVSIPSIGEELLKAQIDFPATRNLFSPAEVIDHIMNNIISEKAKKAFLPDATEKDLQSYWLNRAFKGTRWKFLLLFLLVCLILIRNRGGQTISIYTDIYLISINV